MEHWKNLSLEKIDGEIWKDCLGYEGCYKISSLGRVMSLKRIVNSSWGSVRIVKEKILRQNQSSKHHASIYFVVRFCVDGICKRMFVHRVVAENFILNLENKSQVNHKDGNKHNNVVSNLEWCTPKENTVHAEKMNLRFSYGEKCPNAILTEKQVIEIRSKYKKRIVTLKCLAKEYGVTYWNIHRIILRKSWARLL